VKCFATIRHSNTDPNVAVVATKLNMVPIIVDRRDPDCAVGTSFSLFAFRFFAMAGPVGSGRKIRPGRSLSGMFPIVGRMIARRATEGLKAEGKRQITAGDGL
jgi:hypothetical protein